MPATNLTPDAQVVLKSAAARLAEEFKGVFNKETIERFLDSSYDQFASHATAVNFLPVLAERFARQRLHALARVEAKAYDGTPIVLCQAAPSRAMPSIPRPWPR
jgi:arsenate reductase